MRETRHLWIGNLPESIREERIAEHFKRYGKIDKVRFLPKRSSENGVSACIAFMDIRSAQKAKAAANVIGDRQLVTNYFDPASRTSSSGNQQTGRNAEEGQRHSHTSGHRANPSHGNRRYEGHREGMVEDKEGYAERYVKDRSSLLDKRFEITEGRGDSYDSDRSKGAEKEKIRSHGSSDAKSEPVSKKHKAESASGKIPKKASKKIADESKPVGSVKKGKKKAKERGRSPTVKHKKKSSSHARTSPSSTTSTVASGKRQKPIASSTDGSTSSGTRSGSTSGSVRSSSSSSTASTSSTNTSRSRSSNSSSSESSYETEGGPNHKKLVAMCIKKLPTRPTVTSLRDGIFHEFKKYGKVKSVVVRGDGAERYALVLFRTAAEANKAINHAKSKLLFGAAIEASIYEGEVSGQELEECGGIIDEFHPRASRTLFVGNLDKTVGYSDIQNIFVRFGEIVAIEIKKQHNVPQYAFLQYTDIAGVVRAITKMDGERLGRNTLKLGFGKTVISSCLWVDGVTESFTENYLASCFQRYGLVKHVVIDRNRGQALVFYTRYEDAQATMAKMRARKLNGSRLKMDYASNELIDIFLKHMQSSGQSIQGLENIRQLLQPPSSPTSSMPTPNVLSNTLPPVAGSSNHHYTRVPSDTREIRSYYEDHIPSTYPDMPSGPYVATESSYRRQWRGRSRERYMYPSETSSHGRHGKRIYEDNYERSDYHRDHSPPTWDYDSNYPDRRPAQATHFDHDYRPKDYDIRREQRPYGRKASGVAGGSYSDTYHHRSSRDRGREGDRGREVERDRCSRPLEGYSHYSRSSYSSPTHSRYLSRRSRSISPGSGSRHREPEHPSSERLNVEPSGYRRRGHSGTRSPESQTEYLHNRRNSVESKSSSSHSGTRYAPRGGDVDMRENISPKVDPEEKMLATIRAGDERIVEFREKPNKGRLRSKVVSDSPRDIIDSSPKRRHHPAAHACRSSDTGSDREVYSRRHGREREPGSTWSSTRSPGYNESYPGNRSRSETPTRDENQDSIGEVIIKQPTVSSSVVKASTKKEEKDRATAEKKTHHDLEPRDRSKPRDKDYRKVFNLKREEHGGDNTCPDDRSSSGSSKHSAKHSRSSLIIKRVHSPVTLERESGSKDFDYRKHQAVRHSKSGGCAAQREKLSRHDSGDRQGTSRSVDDMGDGKTVTSRSPLPVPSSHRGHQDPVSRQRSGGSGAAKLLKREYSPGSGPEHRYKKSQEWPKEDPERQRSLRKEHAYLSNPRVKDERSTAKGRENVEDVDDRRYLPVKRRHSMDTQDDDSLNLAAKRERKSSVTESNLAKSKGGHHHHKHEAPMSIARQMFLQEEDDSGADSPRDLRTKNLTLPTATDLDDKGVKTESLDADVEQRIDDKTVSSQEDAFSVKKRKSRWELEGDGETAKPEPEEDDPQPAAVTTDYPDVAIASAKSLLPRRLPRIPPQAPTEVVDEDVAKSGKTKEARDSKGNLLDLEREKKRLQELLSKLDSENLDMKDAEEVADVVLKELAEKAKSKLLASKPVKTKPKQTITPSPSTSQAKDFDDEAAEEEVHADSVIEAKCEEVLEEEMTVEEEIVVDSYEEFTSNEDEVIETVVEEESVTNFEREINVPDLEKPQTENSPATDDPTSAVPAGSVEDKIEAIDAKQGYRKQMEAKRKEMQKIQKKLESERKKLLKKQEKEKKRQMKRVQAMRGPSQSVISSVDDEDCRPSSEEEVTDIKPHEEDGTEKSSDSVNILAGEQAAVRKSAEASNTEVDCETSLNVKTEMQDIIETEVCDDFKSNSVKTEADEKCEPSPNLDLQKPWPPDKPGALVDDRNVTSDLIDSKGDKGCLTGSSQKRNPGAANPDDSCVQDSITACDIATEEIISENDKIQPPVVIVASRTQSPLTPSAGDRKTPATNSTPVLLTKDATQSQKSTNVAQNVTPSGSLSGTSSVSQRSSHTTPVTTPSNSTKTPTVTTPSPASSSSTSSSKSQSKHHLSKGAALAAHPGVQRQSSQSYLMKKSGMQGKHDHHSRSRSSHHGQSSDHKRRPSHPQRRPQHGHGHRSMHESHKMKPIPTMSRRTMAIITVGLDASPSKPLCKSELERLKMELESVKSQLNLDTSPGSLSPCSGDEENGGKSPAQLLSPASPVLRSPAEVPSFKKTYYSNASPSSTGISLTDRMKLLGRVKKKASVPGLLTKPEELKPAAERRECEFQQARLLRSSIFDQDLQRLSHIQRQREEVKRRDEEQRQLLFSGAGVLFSNSTFLQDNTNVNGFETQAGSGYSTETVRRSGVSVAVTDASPSLDNARFSETDANVSVAAEQQRSVPPQSQMSSMPGPKNVLSLSSCDLPAAAEREAHDVTGKVCNTVADNQIVGITQAAVKNNINVDEIKPESDACTTASMLGSSTITLVAPAKESRSVNITRAVPESADVSPEDFLAVQEPSVEMEEKDLDGEKPELETPSNQRPDTENGSEQVELAEASVKSEHVTEQTEISDVKLELVGDLDGELARPGSALVEEVKDSEDMPESKDKEAVEEPESIHRQDEYFETDMEIVCDMNVYTDDCLQVVETSVETEASFHEGESVPTESSTIAENKHMEVSIDVASGDGIEPAEDEVKTEESTGETDISSAVLDKSEDLKEDVKKATSRHLPNQDEKVEAPEKKKCRPLEKQKRIGQGGKETKKSTLSKQENLSEENKNFGEKTEEEVEGTGKTSSSSKPSLSHKQSVPTNKPIKVTDSKTKTEKSDVQQSKTPAVVSKAKGGSSKKKMKTSSSKEPTADPERKNSLNSSEEKSKTSVVSKKVDHERKAEGKSETKSGNPKVEAKEKKIVKHMKKDKKTKLEKADEATESRKTKTMLLVTSKDDTEMQTQEEATKIAEKPTTENTEAYKGSETEKQATKLTKKESFKNDETRTASGSIAEAKKLQKKKKKIKHGIDKDLSSGKSLSAAEGKSIEKTSHKEKEEDPLKESDKVEKTIQKQEKSTKLKPSGKSKPIDSKKKTSTLDFGKSSTGNIKRHDSAKNSTETQDSKKLHQSSGKAVAKQDPARKSKKHKDLKPSHSLPSSSKEKGKDVKQPSSNKKSDGHEKTAKSSSTAGAGQHSRYSLIYDSSSDDNSDNSLGPPPTKKSATNLDSFSDDDENNYSTQKDPLEEDRGMSEQKQSNWPDLDEDNAGPRRLNSSSSVSSSSSSSMSDSGGPPPVVSSSLVVTETIKNETILPPDYVDYNYDSSPTMPPAVSKIQSEDNFQKKHSTVKKKKSKMSISTSHKDPAKGKKFSKPSIRRIIMSSTSESSDDEFETSDSSDNDTLLDPVLPSKREEKVNKPKQKDHFVAENDLSSDGDELENANNVATSNKATKSVSELKKIQKVESKSQESGKPLKKIHQSSTKTSEKVKLDSKPKSESKVHKQEKLKSRSSFAEKVASRSKDTGASVKKDIKHSEKCVEKEKRKMHSSSTGDKSKLQKVVKETKDKPKSESSLQEDARIKEVKPEKQETPVTIKKEKEVSSRVSTSSSSFTSLKTTLSDQVSTKELSKLAYGKQVEGGMHSEQKRAKAKAGKEMKPKEKSSSEGKHSISSKQNIHKSKKKRDKSDKKEEKKVIHKDPTVSSPVKDATKKSKEKNSQEALKALTHSLFSSDSDEDENDKGSVPPEHNPGGENLAKSGKPDSSALPQEHAEKLMNSFAKFSSSSFNLAQGSVAKESVNDPAPSSKHPKSKHQSKQKHQHQSSDKGRHHFSSAKKDDRRHGTAENFLTTSTTDESDMEQRLVVQSAISSLDKGDDIQSTNDADREEQGGLQIVEDEMSPVAGDSVGDGENWQESDPEPLQLHDPVMEDDKLDKVKTIEPQLAVDPAAKHEPSPKHKLKTGKSKSKAKRKLSEESKLHKDKPSEGSMSHSVKKEPPFFSAHHRTNYDRISRMKSFSHERDEEAVRSIVGIMDDSSDADSYYSDVKPEADVSHKSSVLSLSTPEKDQSSRELSNEPSSGEVCFSSSEKVKEELSQEELDRSAAELNELAAAVSSIEGLFGDFSEEKSPAGAAHSTAAFIKQERKQQEVSQQQEEQQSETVDDINTESQEDMARGSSEAELAANALLMESADDLDESFIEYKEGSVSFHEKQGKEATELKSNLSTSTSHFALADQGEEKPEPSNEISLERTERVPATKRQSTHNGKAPSVQMGLAESQPAAKLTSPPPISTPSRKRPRQSTGVPFSGRSSSHDSKSDRSYSDTSASESEHPHEVKGNRRKGAKQRKVDADQEPPSGQSKSKDSYDFDSDLKAPSLSLPAPGASHPFVATSAAQCSASPLHQIPAARSLESVSISHSPSTYPTSWPTSQVTVPVASQAAASISNFPAQAPPTGVTKSTRKTSRDSDAACPVPTSTSRRSSSSSSSTHSPSRGFHHSQLTSPPGNAASVMQPPATMHETTFQSTASIQPRPFVSQIHTIQPSNIHNQEARSHITLSSSLPSQIPLYTNQYPVTASAAFEMPNMIIASRPLKTPPHSYVDIPRHPYAPMQASAQRPLAPSPAQQRVPYPLHAPHTFATKIASSNAATSMPVFHSGAVSYPSSVGLTKTTGNNAMVITANSMPSSNMLSLPPATSLTPSRPHQFSFTQPQTGVQPQIRMPSGLQQHHIGVPTYPHSQPAQSQNQSRLSQPPSLPNANIQNLPRPSFSQPLAPHALYGQPLHHIYQVSSLQNQPTTQHHPGHPSYAMHSPNTRPPLEAPQTSPGIAQGPPSTPQHVKQKQNVQRTPSNPYLHPQAPPTVPQTPASKPSVPPQTEQPHVHNIDAKKNERDTQAQVPPVSPHIHTSTPTQLSPQTGIRKMDLAQPRIPSMPRPVLPSQPLYHQLYFPQAMMQNVPGPERPFAQYPPGIHGLPPGMQFQRHPLTTAALTPQFQTGQTGLPHGLVIRPTQLQMPPAPAGEKEIAQTAPHIAGVRTPVKREQMTPNPSNRATPNAPPHLPQHAEPMSQPPAAVQMHPQSMQPHQAYLRPPNISPVAPYRPPHDRLIRSQPDISQEDMVEQHFRKSGFPNSPRPQTPAASSTVPSSAGTVSQVKSHHDGHAQHRAAISPRAPRTQNEQELSGSNRSHPGSYPSASVPQTQSGLPPFPSGYPGMLPGVPRFDTDMQMWPRMTTNFRPPSVPLPGSQVPGTQVPETPRFPPHSATAPAPTDSAPPQTHRPDSTPATRDSSTPSTAAAPVTEEHNPVMDLFQRYPVIWQGLLALKNDSAAVQTHYICGDIRLAYACLPKTDSQIEPDNENNLAVLRIVQRMRLEPTQLEGVDKKMMADSDFCLLLALPCGRDETDVIRQQSALKQGFIDYLTQKQAAGIINIQNPQTQGQVQYVLHVFPPCEFTTAHLHQRAQDLLSNINDIQHLMIVIASV